MKPQTELVYQFIKNSDHPVTQWEIYCALQGTGHELRWSERQNMHNDHIRKMHDIVEEINRSDEVDELIFQHAYRYSIATEEQVKLMIDFYNSKGLAAFNLRNYVLKKKRLDGQYDLVRNEWRKVYGD